jgi:hypothetical protein
MAEPNDSIDSNVNVFGRQSYFNEDTKFFKDVYVYGRLHYDFESNPLEEFQDVTIKGNLEVFGTSIFHKSATFNDSVNFSGDVSSGILTVTKRLDVGVGGTVLRAISDYDGLPFVSGVVGIGITSPRKTLDVIGTAIFSENVGIGTTNPDKKLVVKGSGGNFVAEFANTNNAANNNGVFINLQNTASVTQALNVSSGGSPLLIVQGDGKIGVGTTTARQSLDVIGTGLFSNKVGIGSTTVPQQELDVAGSVKIDKNIFDRVNSPGFNNYYLSRDVEGIRWVPLEPVFSEGIFVQEEGIFIPTTGIAKSFTTLNFTQKNSLGLGITNIIPIPNDSVTIADIQSFDLWGFVTGVGTEAPIYRMTNVGIENNNPTETLDITGTLRATDIVKFTSATDSSTTTDGALIVTGGVGIAKKLNVGGISKISDATDSSTTTDGALIVTGGVGIGKKLNVGGISKISDATDSSTTTDGALIVTGGVGIGKKLNVGGISKISDATDSSTTTDGALIVTGGVGIGKKLNVGGISKFSDATDSTLTTDGALIVTGGVGIGKKLNVGGATDIDLTLNVDGATTLKTTLQVGIAGTVITTTGIGSVGIGTNLPSRGLDIAKEVLLQKALYDSNRNVGFKTEFYKTPRTVLGQVAVGATGEVIGDRFFDAANLIRLNLDFIAAEAVGFITSTSYKSPAFVVPGISSCKDDIKDILKAITLDITKGGNSQSVGAGLSYYNGASLIHITGNDVNGYSIKDATIVAITTAAQISQAVINNTLWTGKTANSIGITTASYNRIDGLITITASSHNLFENDRVRLTGLGFTCPSGAGITTFPDGDYLATGRIFPVYNVVGINTFKVFVGLSTLDHTYVGSGTIKKYQTYQNTYKQIKDLTIQNDASVNSNENFSGCSNVVSAIYTCAGIVTAIIGGGSGSAPTITQPDGKVVWVPPGADVRNLIFVNKYGNDYNGGKTEGDAKLTIAGAAEIAEPGDTIMVRSGVYRENNPIGLRNDVSVTGQDLRLVTVIPKNNGKDVFHVRRGCLVENMNFNCEVGETNRGGGAVAFPPLDSTKFAVSGFIESGPATEGPTGRWRSPYIRNCTNFMPFSIGMKIDGNHATASTPGADLKSMVCDSFTQYNEAGIGVSITNSGYAQLVSIFTINCDIAIYCDTGGSCDLTNSNSSFGNFGLVAVGLGVTEFTGKVLTATTEETDTIIIENIRDTSNLFRRPFDGQAIWFKDVGPGIALTEPLRRLARVELTSKGSGYSASSPPNVIIIDTGGNTLPLGPEGIIAEVSATVDDTTGQLSSIDVINSGRNYLPSQNIIVQIDGNATANAIMEPIYFTVESSTDSSLSGTATVTLAERVPYLVGAGTSVEFRRISRILTSGHSFEYIGTGTDINISTPFQGSIPIKENEVVARDGARIPFTSTDQKGNFDIGEGIRVDQTTNTIRGRDFSKAIQAEVTPLILALR